MPPMKTGRMRPKNVEQLVELREQVLYGFVKLEEKHARFTAYRCNHCRSLVAVRCPTREQVVDGKGFWDSIRECLACGRLNFVCVFPTGRTSALAIDFDPEDMDDHTTFLHVPVAFEIINKYVATH